jgi:hypothetical protein
MSDLQPDLLQRIALDAIEPFYDASLDRRVSDAKAAWVEQAQARLDAQIDQEQLARIRTDAEANLGDLRDELDALNESLSVAVDGFDLPEIEIPAPVLNGHSNGLPLIDSDWDFAEQSRRLKESRAYE